MIPMFKVRMSEKVPEMVTKTLQSGMVGEGERVVEFKQALEKRFGCKNLIPLNSGTSALILALRLIGVEGKEVITTPFTMIATNVAIKAAGGIPVFADINENNVNISPKSIKEKITPNTAAILVVHVGGVPCDMQEIMRFGIPVVSDAAHAIDARYKGEHISAWADYTMFSFQAIKQLNTGDGGALVVRDDEQYRRGEKLKWFGMTRIVPEGMTRLEHQMTADVLEWGYKMHMNDITASIGLANLELLDDTTKRQKENAEYYLTHLEGLPVIPADSDPSWWGFYLFVKNQREFIQKLKEKGIETTPMWRRNDEYSVFGGYNGSYSISETGLPNMDKLQDKVVFIPVGWWLTEADREYIVKSVKEVIT